MSAPVVFAPQGSVLMQAVTHFGEGVSRFFAGVRCSYCLKVRVFIVRSRSIRSGKAPIPACAATRCSVPSGSRVVSSSKPRRIQI